MSIRWISLFICAIVGACASSPGNPSAQAGTPADAGGQQASAASEKNSTAKRQEAPTTRKKSDRVTIETPYETLGNLVRAVGEQTGGNIVLMNGVQNRAVQNIEIRNRTMADSAAIIAANGGLTINEHAVYFFLFPDGYEQIMNLSLAGRLDRKYANITTDAAFGSDLPLFSVFMWIGYALDVTIVADNSIGDAKCGELALSQVSLETALEAILKSARVVSLAVDSTPEYIFFAAPANKNPKSLLLNPGTITPAQRTTLDKTVTLSLPRPLVTGQRMELSLNASKLGDVLPYLSEQLGVQVVAEERLLDFPVNPFYVHQVKLETAMDLLLRQWLEANYGYQMDGARIVIRRK